MTSEITVRPASQSLAEIACDLEAACMEIDASDGEISPDLMKRFECANLALSTKVDRWIGYLDGVKGMIATLEVRAKRSAAALSAARSLENGLKKYVKMVIETTPNVPYKGESGTLYLHGEGDKLKFNFKFCDKTVREVVEPAFAEMEPSVRPYLMDVTHQIINKEKLKADLLAGVRLNWAETYYGKHVRTKG